MNRALRAATMGVLLLSPLALSACSAGQVTQTATQERDKVGGMAAAGEITLRQAVLEYPDGGVYEAGEDAEMVLAIVNSGPEADTLVEISGEGFGEAEITPAGAASPATEVAVTTAPATGSAPATGTSTPPPPAETPTTSSELEIPAESTVFIGGSEGAAITLTDLDEALTTGQSVELTLTFENAGEITLPVPVDTPDRSLERGEAFDFHHEEEAANEEGSELEGSEGDAAHE